MRDFFIWFNPKSAFNLFHKGTRRIRKDSQSFLGTISKFSNKKREFCISFEHLRGIDFYFGISV